MTKKKHNKSTGRNYADEYARYQGKPQEIKERSNRNKARRKMIAAGKARVGDGLDVAHKNNNENDNDMDNLEMQTKRKNRAVHPRERKGRG